jgi:hypothetical protein
MKKFLLLALAMVGCESVEFNPVPMPIMEPNSKEEIYFYAWKRKMEVAEAAALVEKQIEYREIKE